MTNLTPKQQRIYDFIRTFTRQMGYPPPCGRSASTWGSAPLHGEVPSGPPPPGRPAPVGRGQDPVHHPTKRVPPRPRSDPLVGHVAAGAPIWAEECIEEYIPFQAGPHPEEYFALKVRGESMLGVGIYPDDLVVIHRQSQARNRGDRGGPFLRTRPL